MCFRRVSLCPCGYLPFRATKREVASRRAACWACDGGRGFMRGFPTALIGALRFSRTLRAHVGSPTVPHSRTCRSYGKVQDPIRKLQTRQASVMACGLEERSELSTSLTRYLQGTSTDIEHHRLSHKQLEMHKASDHESWTEGTPLVGEKDKSTTLCSMCTGQTHKKQ
ncbi:hypothetical protein BaRGS_00000664 [Batillaria attramentaria]|uniref:Uncharacterized protein n=1 Tax=Batillaria attramentaria TaxID=370345 RepID=A0ABD0MAH3_9CAEN